MARIRFVWIWMLLVAGVLVQAQEIEITPSGQPLIIGLGMRQTILCNVTVHDASIKPRWVAPVNATYKSENQSATWRDGTFTKELYIIFESFREEDAGVYTCTFQETASRALESKTTLVAGCPFGKYGDNSNNCINCSQNCATPADPHISPCNLTDGTCVAGCREGYSGRNCTQTVPDEDSSDEGTVGIIVGVVVPVVVLVLVITAAICYCRVKNRACFSEDGLSCGLIKQIRQRNESPSAAPVAMAVTTNSTETNDVTEPTESNPLMEGEEVVAPTDTGSSPNMAEGEAGGPHVEGERNENQSARVIPNIDTETQTQPLPTPTITVTQENSSKVVDRIRYDFIQSIDPHQVINLFHKYNEDVLTKQDIEHVTRETDNHGNSRGAADLLSRLPHYQGWYECLQKVMRTDVKLSPVADKMNDLIKDI